MGLWPQNKICIFGDSLVQADTINYGWAYQLRWHLEENYKVNFEIYILGIDGDTSTTLLQRAPAELAAREPHQVIYAIGKCDASYLHKTKEFTTTEEQFEKNLKDLIKHAKKYTNDIAFIGLTPSDDEMCQPCRLIYDDAPFDSFTNKRTLLFDKIIRNVAGETDCAYIPVFDSLDLEADFYRDKLHPNTDGHTKMFSIIKDYFVYS